MSSKYTPHTVETADLIRLTVLTHLRPVKCQGHDFM